MISYFLMCGGQAIPLFDYYLAPYVAKSFVRNYAKYYEILATTTLKDENIDSILSTLKDRIKAADKWIFEHNGRIINEQGKEYLNMHVAIPNISNVSNTWEKAWNYALRQTERDTYQAMEALIHNLCTLNSRSGGQVPFSSINTGTDTTVEGRIVTRNLFLAQDAGLGYHETPIFPITIMKMKKGVTDKGSPNYDLFQLACRVSAKRLFPTFLNLDATFNAKYYKEGRPETEVATMGMVKEGYVRIKINSTAQPVKVAIKDVYSFLKKQNLCSELKMFDKCTYFCIVHEGVLIQDQIDDKIFVPLKKWMKSVDTNTKWCEVVTKNGYKNTFSSDHPLVMFEGMAFIRLTIEELEKGNNLVGLGIDNPQDLTQLDLLADEILSITPVDSGLIVGYDVETESDRFNLFTADGSVSAGIVSHNCRTRVIGNYYKPDNEITPGRGNIFAITINLPYIALTAKEKVEQNGGDLIETFFKELYDVQTEVFDCSMDRLNILSKRKLKNYPFLMGQHLYVDSEKYGPEDCIGPIIKNGTITTGFIGLAETLVVLIGKHHGESEEAQELGLKIVGTMNDRCIDETHKTHLNFSLMGSPAEGCCGRLLKCTRNRFGTIAGVTDHEYLSNSNHCPVYYQISAKRKVDIEAPYHELEPAGHISYLEVQGNPLDNVEAFQSLIEYMAEKNMGYFAINHPVDFDPVCGYTGIIEDVCPRCGRKEGESISYEKYLELKKQYDNVPEYVDHYTTSDNTSCGCHD